MKEQRKIGPRAFAALIENASFFSGLIAALAMFLVAIITTYEAILRRIFNSPTTWVFSLSLFAMVWFPLLAAPLGIREGRQITVDFLVSRLPESIRSQLTVINYFFSLIFIVTLGYYGLDMCMDAYARGITSVEFLRYPKWLMYLVFPVATALMCLQIIRLILSEVTQLLANRFAPKAGWQGKSSLVLALYLGLTALGVYIVQVSPLAGIIFLILCLMIGGLPVSFALGCCGLIGLFLHYQGFVVLAMIPVIVERTLNNFVLLAVPLFIMAGIILNKCGIGERVFDFASNWLGSLPGGLAIATVIACAIFSAIIGISTAVAAAIGFTAIPLLLARGYTKELAYGSVAGGALGVLIPPSAGLIFYGYLTNSSVGKLFAAAFVPGFVVVGLFATYCVFYCLVTGKYEKPSVTWKGRIISLKKASLGLSAPLIALGGIYSGFFTPTEAAGVLVVYSMIISLIHKSVNWREFVLILKESAELGSVLMMVMLGGMVLAHLTVRLQVAASITEWVATAQIPYWMTITAIFLLYLILGMFLDGLSATILTVPILFPLMPVLGIDVIVFGVVLMIFFETALLTPPVGLNLFIVQAITGDNLWPIFKGNIPFAALLLLGAVLLFMFPQLALWLPSILGL